MNNLYVLDRNLDSLVLINEYTARQWTTVWGGSGEFTLWAPLNSDNAQYLVEDNIIYCEKPSLGIRTISLGVIEVVTKDNGNGEGGISTVQVSGRFTEANFLGKRIIWGHMVKSGKVGEVIQEMLTTQVISPTNPKRKIPRILLNTPLPSLGESIVYTNSYGNVWEQINSLSLTYNLDFRLNYDVNNKVLNCSLQMGRDLTKEVIISSSLGILFDSSYVKDISDYCNSALVAGEGEGINRTTVSLGDEEEGFDRRELYVDARDLQSTNAEGFSIPREEYLKGLRERGKQKLSDHPPYESYEATISMPNSHDSYVYGVDYLLGDTITLIDEKLGVSVKAIVREEVISEEDSGTNLNLVFGLSLPTITQIIKQKRS